MKRRGPSDDDLANAPFVDDAERTESEWLVARERDPDARSPSSKIASDYAEIDDLLSSLPMGPSDESWHEDVLRLASASVTPLRPWWRRPAFRWTMGGTLLATAAVVLIVLQRPQPPTSELEVAIHERPQISRGAGEILIGDRLIVRARPHGTGELRVYRTDGPLVARCPNGPGCTTPAQREQTIEVTLDAPGQYHVILVSGIAAPLPDGPMDTFIEAARAVNARVAMYKPIDVH